MNKILSLCLVLTLSNTSARWTKESEEVTKDLKDEKENLKEAFSQWKENIAKRHTTTSTSTTTNNDEFMEAIEELKNEMKEIKQELKNEMKEMKKDLIGKIKTEPGNIWDFLKKFIIANNLNK